MKLHLFLVAASLMLVNGRLDAANYLSTWTNPGSGSWEEVSNWNIYPQPVPGADKYFVTILDSVGNRTITTSGNITIAGLSLNQSSNTGSLTLALGGNMTVAGGYAGQNSNVSNTTSDSTKVVIDLNGYNLNYSLHNSETTIEGDRYYTVKSTGSKGGVMTIPFLSNSALGVVIEDNVTLRSTVTINQYLIGRTFSAASTLQMAGTGAYTLNFYSGVPLGNFVIGDSANTAATNLQIANVNAVVRGNVTINSFTGATGGSSSRLHFDNNSRTLSVGGNFVDHGTDGWNYNGGTIILNGGIDNQRELSIGRQLNTSFSVGNAVAAGNVALAKNLVTSGTFTVYAGSTFDARTSKVSGGHVVIGNNATIALTVDASSGFIHSIGNLDLTNFKLELALGDGWVNGENLLLFSFDGTLNGTYNLTSLIAGDWLTYDELVYDSVNKEIFLKNVSVVPEPRVVSLALLSVGAIAVMARRRRKFLAA